MNRRDCLYRGRRAYSKGEWQSAYAYLSFADLEAPLSAVHLTMLSECAYLLGGEAQSLEILERAYHTQLRTELPPAAARTAFWIGFRLQLSGDGVLGEVWLARARHHLEECVPCASHGLLFLSAGCSCMSIGNFAVAHEAFLKASEVGMRFGDLGLVALAKHYQGRARIRAGQPDEGMALLDESMASIAQPMTSPIIVGGIFCSALDACGETMDIRRADQWTAAFTTWRDSNPSMVAFRAESLAYRVALMQLRGAWRDALDEIASILEWLDSLSTPAAAGLAYYQRGELYRLRGEHDAASIAYQEAAKRDHKPQPGLAQLWLAQGQIEKASEEIRRLLVQATQRPQRARILVASVEILLAGDHVPEARACAEELSRLDAALRTPLSYAVSAHAIGAVLLCEDRPKQAIVALRDAMTAWSELGARYHAAKARVLIAAAHRELGDEVAAKAELLTSAHAFDALGAAADRAHAEDFYRRKANPDDTFLTARQIDVLRLLALGMSDAAIAESLGMTDAVIAKEVIAIFQQLHVLTREQAAERARARGLI